MSRRSLRKTKKALEKEEESQIAQLVIDLCEEGLVVSIKLNCEDIVRNNVGNLRNFQFLPHFYEACDSVEKGRSVRTTKKFLKGQFVVEYAGDLINRDEAKLREEKYTADGNTSRCYMYYFEFNNHQLW